MVKATDTNVEMLERNGVVDTAAWLSKLKTRYSVEDLLFLEKAVGLLKNYPQRYLVQGIAIASILIELRLGISALLVGMLLEAFHDQKISLETIAEQFSPQVLKLLDGVKKMEAISALHISHVNQTANNQDQVDKLRKMLLAMAEDSRVILIKLAEHLYLLRQVKDLSAEEKQQIARQTRDIYAPLANRLGIGKIKWEIEDLAFRYLEPEAYKTIAHLLDEKRLDREGYIQKVVTILKSALKEDGVDAEVTGRVKHIYSIWRKMQRKHVDYEEIYDVRALRILVHKELDCYAALGTVHRLWQHIPKEFDDYIATPKENGYRSLHTAVIGPEGKTVEVQIRTMDMHLDSELGVAAHWRYKEGAQQDTQQYKKKTEWLRQLADKQHEMADAEELIAELRTNVSEERVYILTPKGEVIDLPQGATPLDFAYSVHTEIGHQCRGAKINGRMVPLTYQLVTGDQVEIITGKQHMPSRDWLNPDAGYLMTSRARAKVQTWFKKQNRDDNIRAGRVLLDREWRRLGLPSVELDKIAIKLNLLHGTDVLAALGGGDLRLAQIVHAISELVEKEVASATEAIPINVVKKTKATSASDVLIEGVDNLLSHMAGCCKPVPGDQILGYITQNTGVSIHRIDCPNALQAKQAKPERLVVVEWMTGKDKLYPVDLHIVAQDRPGLLRDVTAVLTQERLNLTALDYAITPTDGTVVIKCRVEIKELAVLGRVMEKIAGIPYIVDVMRAF